MRHKLLIIALIILLGMAIRRIYDLQGEGDQLNQTLRDQSDMIGNSECGDRQ